MPAYSSGRAGQHFELFNSILSRVKKVTTYNHSLRMQYRPDLPVFNINKQNQVKTLDPTLNPSHRNEITCCFDAQKNKCPRHY